MASQAGSGTSRTKGNPASKRMSNVEVKYRRERSWKRGQERKKARIIEQRRREKENRELRAAGLPTPWEEAKLARRYARGPGAKPTAQDMKVLRRDAF